MAALGLATLAASLGFAACGEPDPYDTSCKADGDCAVVPVKPGCGCDECSKTVINRSEVERYNQDREDEGCNNDEAVPCAPPASPCQAIVAFCANGKCALR